MLFDQVSPKNTPMASLCSMHLTKRPRLCFILCT